MHGRVAGSTAMTERKPPGMRYETWVERQIREAQERGAFDDLPGAGKPIPGLDRPFTAEKWAADWVKREGGDLSPMLSPLLLLRRERAELLASLADVPNEPVLRATVEDFNRRLLDQYRRPMDGPLVPVGVLDVEDVVATWRQTRAQAPPSPDTVTAPTPEPPHGGRWRRWLRRRAADGGGSAAG